MTTPAQPDDQEHQSTSGRGVDAETTTVGSSRADNVAGDGRAGPGGGGGSGTTSTGTPPPWQRSGATGPQPVSSQGDGPGGRQKGPGQGGPGQGAGGQGAGGQGGGPHGAGPQRPPQGRGGPGQRSNTALIDAPTNQLSPEQLGMRASAREAPASEEPEDIAELSSSRATRSKTRRRASLQVKRFDPWSVLKLAGVLAVALFFVWMFAVGVLYAVLDGMGVWAQLNGTYQTLTSDTGGSGQLITAGGVFGVAAIIGAVNAILFTAHASISSFNYNISADVAGGIEVTLSEPD